MRVMQVLSAKNTDGEELSLEQIRVDWDKIKEADAKAMAAEPTWAVFGGVLYVNGNEYQVA